MIDYALTFLTSALRSCFNWFTQLLDSMPGSWQLIFSMITIYFISRFILAPLFGHSVCLGSDRAARNASQSTKSKKLEIPSSSRVGSA